ncbi:acyl-CoA synthetase [Microbacterium resistens]
MTASASPTFSVRHVQLVRALFAAVAALMITFSPDHSAAVGLSVFSGFALATGLVLALAAWLVARPGWRWPYVLLAAFSFLAGMAGGIPAWRSTPLFFVLVIAWGALTGLVELIAGIRARTAAQRGEPVVDGARDHLLVGVLGLLLAVALLLVPMQYAWTYSIEDAGDFILTGITLAVGIFGAYAAIVAVLLGIAGFSPRPATEHGGTA